MNENWTFTELPKGWVWTRFESISRELKAGGTPLTKIKEYYEDGNIPFVKIEDIVGSGKYLYDTKTRITEQGLRNSSAWLVPRNSLLYSMYASYGEPIINKIEVATSQAIIAYIPPQGLIVLDYVYYYLEKIRTELTTRGTTQKNLNGQIVKLIPIPLAPFNEQIRIVAKLEELFTRLDAGVEGLRKAKAQLKRYRQAVLKYAFEGKLTEEWRKTHRDQIEPATKLLERLREVKKGTKFKELRPIDIVDVPILPEEWTWTRIGEIAESMRNGVYKPKEFYGNNGVACLRMYNIENGAIAWKDVKRMNLTPEEIEFYELGPGDILVNRVNSRELVGKAAAIPVGLERCVYESKNIRLRLLQDYANSKYVSFWFLVYSQKFFNRNAQQTVGMASINQEQLALMPIPLCHPNEQTKAVEEIERLFSIADEVEKIATENIEQTDKMRQSILKMAFEGKIVPQDPGDETANKLLERIREERAKFKGEKDAKRRMKNKPRQLVLSGYVE